MNQAMTNEQLTWAFGALAGYVIGHSIAQWQGNQRFTKRLDAHKKAMDLIASAFTKQRENTAEVINDVQGHIEKLMALIIRGQKPPEATDEP